MHNNWLSLSPHTARQTVKLAELSLKFVLGPEGLPTASVVPVPGGPRDDRVLPSGEL